MTLSPVFLGTIRSRLVIALMPVIVCICILILETKLLHALLNNSTQFTLDKYINQIDYLYNLT